jgi:hypothetical protein
MIWQYWVIVIIGAALTLRVLTLKPRHKELAWVVPPPPDGMSAKVVLGRPACCPFCQANEPRGPVQEWAATTPDDPHYTTKLQEWQCSLCHSSFWV